MVIVINDHVLSGGHTNEDGQVIYDLISTELISGEEVVLSFKGINAVSSSFLNTALVPLLECMSFDQIKKKLKIVNSNRATNDMILMRFQQENELVRN